MNEYILVGTPNCGKTTIFNAITGLKEKVGNWHGVTAKVKKGGYISKKSKFTLVDLPGIYSLKAYSCEEKETVNYILNGNYKGIILVLDATSPYGANKLLQEILPLNKRVIILVNKTKKATLFWEELQSDAIYFYEINPFNNKSVKAVADNINSLKCTTKNFNLEFFKNNKTAFYDRYLLNRYIFLPLFFCIIFVCYFFAFSNFFGGRISKYLSFGVEEIAEFILQLKNNFFCLLLHKTLNSLSGVISLIPQVVILQFGLFMVEESGLSCRFCVIVYNFLSKLGLSGKSLFPIVSSLGCGAVSVKTCNACENACIKNNTLNILPFVPCSAKNSVVIFICLKTFSKPYLMLFLSYFCLLIITIIYAFIRQKFKRAQKESMFIELVEIAFPNLKRVGKELVESLSDFFKKIISTCLIISFALAILTTITPKLTISNGIEDSILCFFSKKFSFVLTPLGITDWRVLLSLMLGLFAKEGVISTICLLYPFGISFTFKVGIVLIFIILVYPPCLTNLVALQKEQKFLGAKIFFKHLLFAYGGGVCLNLLLTKPIIFCIITILVVGFSFIYARIYFKRKRKTNFNFAKTRVKLFHNSKTL